jgi:uncharacterized protein YyaL (SSP411 family)
MPAFVQAFERTNPISPILRIPVSNMKLLLLFLGCLMTLRAAEPALDWKPWSDSVFAQAKSEQRFVLLDLEAVWCHWCHVMEATTYKDPATVALLKSKYILVRVDQDSRPDLSNRYEDYGWPATVVFNGDGQEIVKRRGYIPPRDMASMLQAIIDDPTPGPSVVPEARVEFASSPFLSAELRKELQEGYLANYDAKHGSWGLQQKFLDWDGVEYALALARKGDAQAEHMARQTLEAQLNLIDPVWGGVYQYSTDGDWKHPHFEKIMQTQSENLRIYSLAYAQWHNPEYLKAALDIHRFLKTFLATADGAFYTSQNADVVDGQHSARYFKLNDTERRRIEIPRIDKHVYARENGWAINALVALYQATSDESYLAEAKNAANWVIQNRSVPAGGFRHDDVDASGPYLGDTLAMARAFMNLYAVTGNRDWLKRAVDGLGFIAANFKNPDGAGFLTAKTPTDHAYKPHPERDENVSVARVANLLFHYTGDQALRGAAEQAMRYVVTPGIAHQYTAVGTLIADAELTVSPVHLTIVGHKDDPDAQRLFQTALQVPSGYKRVEWWDKREGVLPNADVEYPELKQAAAFVCTDKSCSSPILKAEQLLAKAERLSQ